MILAAPAAADYPMFHADPARTGMASTPGPLNDTLLWSAEIDEFPDGAPAVHDGKVYLPTWPDMNFTDADPMGLVCCDAASGEVLWTNELGGQAVGSVSGVAGADGHIYIGGTDGKVYAVDADTGVTLWSSEQIDTTAYFGLSSSPLVYNGTVYVLSASDGVLHAFGTDGTGLWTFQTGGAIGYYISPSAADGKVYVAGKGNEIFCIDAGTHTAVWNATFPEAVKSTPVVSDGRVYATTADHLYALDATTGTEAWNAALTGTYSTPAISDDIVIAGSSNGLHAYNATTGAELWTFASARVSVSPTIADDIVYSGTNEETGRVYAVNIATGIEVWSYVLPDSGDGTYAAFYTSSPAISDGVLYIGAENNRLYAFGEGSSSPEVIWDGAVSITEGEIFTFVPSNNASASYEMNRTTDIGALDRAATDGGFTYNASDAWYADFGSFLLEDINGIENQDWTQENAHAWSIFINGEAAPMGFGANDIQNGDTLTFYYCPTDSVTWAPLIDQATYIVTIDVEVTTATVIWDGAVAITEGEIFTFVPSNNESASYEMNRTTDIGALDRAATDGGFTYNASDAWYADFGSFLLEDINGIENQDWTQENAHAWSIFINGGAAPMGFGANDIQNGDTLTFYYCPTDSVTWAPLIDQATYIVTIDVEVTTATVIWDGAVAITEGEIFTFVPSNNESASYEMNRTTDIGALDRAATDGGFTYNASDAWYADFGSFLLEDINGIENQDWTQENAHAWSIFINGEAAPMGFGANDIQNGDTITFYYCPTDSVTWAPLIDQATYIVTIDVCIAEAAVDTPSLADGTRGGFVLAEINATAEESGWYVVVVSGTDASGEAIAGTGTVRLNSGETVQVPVLVSVPAQASAGTYTLYAGIYHLDEYPEGLISHSGGSECVVS
ncbi:outer membrane protein assembly factor BamB family protein [Methanofollis fontis]|nr:PQQ-binding-like beta-propeller repeat protein [Methanofollis fontis]